MKTTAIDHSKLLGFDREGAPIFDIVMPSQRDGADARAVGTSKAEGGSKTIGGSKLIGGIKT